MGAGLSTNTLFKLAKRISQPPQHVVHLDISVFAESGVAVGKDIDLAFHRAPRLDQLLDMCRSIFFHWDAEPIVLMPVHISCAKGSTEEAQGGACKHE